MATSITTWQITSNTARTIDDGRRRSVTVTSFAGRVNVMAGAPGTTAVHLEVADVRGPAVRIEDSGTAITVEHLRAGGDVMSTVREWFASRGDVSAALTLTVPPGTRVAVRTVKAPVVMSGLTGTVYVKAGAGSVTLSGLSGAVDAVTGNAAVLAERLSGDLKLKSAGGDLTVSDSAPASVRTNTVSGVTTLDLTGPSLVTAGSISGDITLRAPEGQGFDVTAQSGSGHVVVDGDTLSGGSDGKRGGHSHEGDRALAAKMKSSSGNVVMLRETPGTAGAGPVIVGDERPRSTVQDDLPPHPPGTTPDADDEGGPA